MESVKYEQFFILVSKSWLFSLCRLYKSPKKLTSDEKCVSTEKWLQKNIDDMDDLELKATRSALLTKLNELKLLSKILMIYFNFYLNYVFKFISFISVYILR